MRVGVNYSAFAAALIAVVFSHGCGESSGTPAAREPDYEIIFTDVSDEAGVSGAYHENGAGGRKYYPEMMGSGGGFVDYNSDGWIDILLMGGGAWEEPAGSIPQSLWLYRNNQDGTFTDVTEEAGLLDVDKYTIGMGAADYDNDGDEDLVITTLTENLFFRNDGGRYVDITAQSGISSEIMWSSSVLFFDADLDGWLDLYIANYADWTPETDHWCPKNSDIKLYCIPADYEGVASRFYRNNGDGTFTDRSYEDGFLPALGKSLGVVEMDYNNDGWSDLAVSNDGEGDLLYENNQDGTFTERGIVSGFAFSEHGEARAGMGIDAGVVDTTGEVSIFIGHFSEETVGVFRHRGNGLFEDRSSTSRIGHASLMKLTFGVFLFDVEYDGDQDLFACNGHVQPDRLTGGSHIKFKQPVQLYLNDGYGQFTEHDEQTGVWGMGLVSRAGAYGDYDHDGDLDIFVSQNDGPMHLWRNDSKTGHFLRVRLEGTTGNREALGARIRTLAGGRRRERRIRTGSSYLSQFEKVASFGLGAAQVVDSLIVSWPGGRVDRFGQIQADKEVFIVEGEPGYTETPLVNRSEPGNAEDV